MVSAQEYVKYTRLGYTYYIYRNMYSKIVLVDTLCLPH